MTLTEIPLETLIAEIERRHGLIHAHEHTRFSPSAWRICEMVAEVFGVPVSGLWSPHRLVAVTVPRQAAMAIIHQRLDLTLQAIGDIFRKDHGTVMHAVRVHENRIATEPAYADKIVKIINRLQP
jgi:chromosomal replication initiation ATPase DnaA